MKPYLFKQTPIGSQQTAFVNTGTMLEVYYRFFGVNFFKAWLLCECISGRALSDVHTSPDWDNFFEEDRSGVHPALCGNKAPMQSIVLGL